MSAPVATPVTTTAWVGVGVLSLARGVVPDGFGVERRDHFVAAGQVLLHCCQGVALGEVGLDAVVL